MIVSGVGGGWAGYIDAVNALVTDLDVTVGTAQWLTSGFLLTLAVVDDVGALGVIALFYSDRIQVVPLAISIGLIVALALVRFLPVARGPAYAVLSIALQIEELNNANVAAQKAEMSRRQEAFRRDMGA